MYTCTCMCMPWLQTVRHPYIKTLAYSCTKWGQLYLIPSHEHTAIYNDYTVNLAHIPLTCRPIPCFCILDVSPGYSAFFSVVIAWSCALLTMWRCLTCIIDSSPVATNHWHEFVLESRQCPKVNRKTHAAVAEKHSYSKIRKSSIWMWSGWYIP